MQLSFVELHKALENFQWNIGNTPLWPTLKCKMSLMHILRNEKKVAWESDLSAFKSIGKMTVKFCKFS